MVPERINFDLQINHTGFNIIFWLKCRRGARIYKQLFRNTYDGISIHSRFYSKSCSLRDRRLFYNLVWLIKELEAHERKGCLVEHNERTGKYKTRQLTKDRWTEPFFDKLITGKIL